MPQYAPEKTLRKTLPIDRNRVSQRGYDMSIDGHSSDIGMTGSVQT
jgi:hypothetical protein